MRAALNVPVIAVYPDKKILNTLNNQGDQGLLL